MRKGKVEAMGKGEELEKKNDGKGGVRKGGRNGKRRRGNGKE